MNCKASMCGFWIQSSIPLFSEKCLGVDGIDGIDGILYVAFLYHQGVPQYTLKKKSDPIMYVCTVLPKPSYIRPCSNIDPSAAKNAKNAAGLSKSRETTGEGPFSTTRIYDSQSTVEFTETKKRKNPGMGEFYGISIFISH
jgi:hypothetical protein